MAVGTGSGTVAGTGDTAERKAADIASLRWYASSPVRPGSTAAGGALVGAAPSPRM